MFKEDSVHGGSCGQSDEDVIMQLNDVMLVDFRTKYKNELTLHLSEENPFSKGVQIAQ